jgi:Protein of unknown function (DUF3429)
MAEPLQNPRLAQALTYAGTLPLIACALLAWMPASGVDTTAVAVAYGAVIVSFISGIHWAASLFFVQRCGYLPLVASNVIALLAWIGLLLHSPILACLLLVLCFVSLLTLDRKLHAQAVLPRWFYRLRCNATAIVIPMLVLVALAPR